jgi:hypothetical protein
MRVPTERGQATGIDRAARSAWERSPAGFIHLPDFDWKAFDGGKGGRSVMQVEHLREALGTDKWARPRA